MVDTQVQFRRGTTAENDAFTGAVGEMTIDTTTKTMRVHDGVTAGGFEAVSGLSRSYLAGLVLSNGSDATNDIDIAVGEARSTADDEDLVVASTISKQLDVTFAAGGTPGSPTGGRSSSVSLTNDTWYHVILGLVSGTAEIGFDTSITGANLVTDHSFTNTRRIGSVRRGTATNLGFSQVGDHFLLDDPPLDVDVNNLGTTAILFTLTVPLGIKVEVITNTTINNSSTGTEVYMSSPDANDEAPTLGGTSPLATLFSRGAVTNAKATQQKVMVRTNTSSQIRGRSSQASTELDIATLGWVDRRGRDD